jgi:hypothetical protein
MTMNGDRAYLNVYLSPDIWPGGACIYVMGGGGFGGTARIQFVQGQVAQALFNVEDGFPGCTDVLTLRSSIANLASTWRLLMTALTVETLKIAVPAIRDLRVNLGWIMQLRIDNQD